MNDTGDRLPVSLTNLGKLDTNAAKCIMVTFKDIAHGFSSHIVEFQFGDIYSRPGLDLRSRLIAAFAWLAALGAVQPQLKFHINAALNTGCSRSDRGYYPDGRFRGLSRRLQRHPRGQESVPRTQGIFCTVPSG